MESFAPAVGSETPILPLLNGMKQLDLLDARSSRQNVLGGKCVIPGTLDDADAIVHLNPLHSMSFRERDGSLSGRIKAVSAQLADAGFDVVASSAQIVQEKWEKWEKWVFLATLAGVTCPMRASVGTIVATPNGETRRMRLYREQSGAPNMTGRMMSGLNDRLADTRSGRCAVCLKPGAHVDPNPRDSLPTMPPVELPIACPAPNPRGRYRGPRKRVHSRIRCRV
jgi:2-dehydropantoate 2-reductase